ncbi:MAG: hydroxymethylglutaryl-CoA reductase, degradative [Deltaproteobacteria bacterium]|nr:hydroxymethylglutaryl-CoA reductase, degradative [Deltaproteobacteria bacterium]
MKTKRTARLPGFYRLSLDERLSRLVETGWLTEEEALAVGGPGAAGGFDRQIADGMSENVIGVHGLPLGICLNLRIDGVDRVAPMAVEEPSVVAAASNAARLVREGGGFEVETTEAVMAAQVQIIHVREPTAATHRIAAEAPALLEAANALMPRMVARGGGARGLETRILQGPEGRPSDTVCVHLLVDCLDAMGANLLNTVAEGLAPRLAALAGGEPGLRILSNYADRRLVRVSCRIPPEALRSEAWPDGGLVRDRIVSASRFAEMDPYRAVTHNKGLMNGIDAVLLATGQDWRQAEAAAHAYAARQGSYGPLAVWRAGRDGFLEGLAELPLAVGTVGGALRAHPGVRLGHRLARVSDARDLAGLAASVGLASNLAALKALATEGIQRGHMGLHARTVAIEVGATGDEILQVAARLQDEMCFELERARAILAEVRGE